MFKLEYSGDGIISAQSKVYACYNLVRQELTEQNPDATEGDLDQMVTRVLTKRTHKGLTLHQNKQLTAEDFLGAVLNETTAGGHNRGMILNEGVMQYYDCARDSITNMYAKRAVMNDHISTVPLDK